MLYVVYIWELNITRTPEKVINTMINNYTKLSLSHTSTPRTEVLQLVFFEFMFEFMLWINISQVRSSCPQSLFGHTGFQNCSPDLTFGKSIFCFFLAFTCFTGIEWHSWLYSKKWLKERNASLPTSSVWYKTHWSFLSSILIACLHILITVFTGLTL